MIVLPISRLSLLIRARTLNKSAELEQRLRWNTKIDVNDLDSVSDMDFSMSASMSGMLKS